MCADATAISSLRWLSRFARATRPHPLPHTLGTVKAAIGIGRDREAQPAARARREALPVAHGQHNAAREHRCGERKGGVGRDERIGVGHGHKRLNRVELEVHAQLPPRARACKRAQLRL
eukprot:3042338-Prymnesium_polylepis.2